MKKREFGLRWLLLTCMIITTLLAISSITATETNLTVPNTAPDLVNNISNQTILVGNNKTDAFDLDDYFVDNQGDEITYSCSTAENITIIINSSTHLVSFYPDPFFMGNRSIYFTASDGLLSSTSNIVYLLVLNDTEPPKWSSPSKSKNTIYQNDYINFSVIWTDNIELKRFIFSIYQGIEWVNYSEVNFTGRQNQSLYRMQISAAPGTTVYWKVYAFDISENMNYTSIQSFNVSYQAPAPSPPRPEEEEEPSFIESILENLTSKKINRHENFSIEPSYFRISLKQGDSTTRILKITNFISSNLSFNLYTEVIKEFVSFSYENFQVAPGETKEITVDFNAKENTPPEQYFGRIIVNSSGGVKAVRTVIEVNPLQTQFEVKVNVLENYKTVMPGDKVRANITLNNLKDLRLTKVKLYTAIKDLEGVIYDSNEEEINFTSSTSLIKELELPITAKQGVYIFYARASNEKNQAINSDDFEVGGRFSFLASFRFGFIILLLALISFIMLMLVTKYEKEKDKRKVLTLYLMLSELKSLIEDNETDKALELYIKIKKMYKEPLPENVMENKDKLKEEIEKISKKLKESAKEKIGPKQEGQKNSETPKQEETKEKLKESKLKVKKEQVKKDKK